MPNQNLDEKELDNLLKSLTEWFGEKWVDISRPKKGGGFEPCGRNDAKTGKYPKCVPASKAARMTPEQIASAVRRKRTAESTQTRDGKTPIYVSTDKEKVEKANVPTDPALYARVKAAAKAKFDVYPSAYANAWLVREYKKRGGGYRVTKEYEEEVSEDLLEEDPALTEAWATIALSYGLVSPEMEDEEEESDEEENSMSTLVSLIRDLLNNKEK